MIFGYYARTGEYMTKYVSRCARKLKRDLLVRARKELLG